MLRKLNGLVLFLCFLYSLNVFCQVPLFKRVLVSDVGVGNNIGEANTSRNLAIDNEGVIYAVYVGSLGVRVAKSTNRGQSFDSSVQVDVVASVEPEIAVNENGIVFVSWVNGINVFFSRSIDSGITFSEPRVIGSVTGTSAIFGRSVHMTTFADNVYLTDITGLHVFRNSNNGSGSFERVVQPRGYVFADIRADKNGVVHLPSDDPTLFLFNSRDNGESFQEINLIPRGSVFFSSYALSESPSGTFIFVAGSGSDGYKMNAFTGESTPIGFMENTRSNQGRTLFADNFGALVDGYRDGAGNIKMSISYDQGITFPLDITIDNAISHSIERNPKTNDLNVIYERNGLVYMDVFDGLLNSIEIVEPIPTVSVCQGDSFSLPFELTGGALVDSEFELFLSDSEGSFENKIKIGSITTGVSGAILANIPSELISSNKYRLQIQSPRNFIQSNIVSITIGSIVDVGVVSDILACDLGSGTAEFDLTSQENTLKNGNLNYTITYHLSKDDAEASRNPITNPVKFVSNEALIWVRVNNEESSQCSAFMLTSFNLKIKSLPNVSNSVKDLVLCDSGLAMSSVNGFSEFDLTTKEDDILLETNKSDFEFSYFMDVTRLTAITNPTKFVNTVANNQTIYVTITDKRENMCSVNAEFDVLVSPLPNIKSTTVSLRQCDTDTDGFVTFNLTEVNRLISDNFNTETFRYYTSFLLAEKGEDNTQIAQPNSYINPLIVGSKVFVRIENNANCYRIVEVELIVGVSNIPTNFFDTIDIEECDDGVVELEYTDGITSFDLTSVDNALMNLFSPLNVNITFYESEIDALIEENKILDITDYRNTTLGKQTIYVRVDSVLNNECQGFSKFEITVNPIPLKMDISDLIACSSATQAVFDLTKKEQEIKAGRENLNVTYFDSEFNRQGNIPIPNSIVSNYLSAERVIYVSLRDDTSLCVNNDISFELKIDDVFLRNPSTLEECNDEIKTRYNLTEKENEIANGNTTLSFQYFKSTTSLMLNTPILNPSEFESELLENSVIVKAININGCENTVVLKLKTTLFPDVNKDIVALQECDHDNDGFEVFDLTKVEPQIRIRVNQAIDLEFKYFVNKEQAGEKTNNGILGPEFFRNTIPKGQTIYVRVEQFGGKCYEIIPFDINLLPTPIINIPAQYVICLNNLRSPLLASSEVLLPTLPIDTGLSEDENTFQWYLGEQVDPLFIINDATKPSFFPASPGTYTVQVSNANNCSYSVTTEVIPSFVPERITATILSDPFAENSSISVAVEGGGQYEYSIDGENFQEGNILSNIRGQEVIIYVRDVYNCGVKVQDLVLLDYPRFFTPNNDGFNDIWKINNSDLQNVSSVFIFNRFGKLLKQLLPNSEGWDGSYQGISLPSGQYWFLVEYLENNTRIKKQFKASFVLKR